VFRHDHISQQRELISPPRLFQNSKKEVASRRRSQMRQSAVATECYEVQRTFQVVALEPVVIAGVNDVWYNLCDFPRAAL